MDHLDLWRRVRRGIAGKKRTYYTGQRQEITAAELGDLTAGAFIWGAEPTPGGICFYIHLPGPAGTVIALLIEGTKDQAGNYAALEISKAEII